MGTRSLTVIQDDGVDLVTIYRQFDGYPTGMGADLKAFLKGMRVINGISGQEAGEAANGMGCLAAQLIQHLKTDAGIGGIYIYPAGSTDCGEEFRYTIGLDTEWPKGARLTLEVKECYTGKVIYNGTLARFNPEKVEEKLKAILA